MIERKITLAVPPELFNDITAICGKRKEYSSKQEFLYMLVEQYFHKESSVNVTQKSLENKEKSDFKKRFYNE